MWLDGPVRTTKVLLYKKAGEMPDSNTTSTHKGSKLQRVMNEVDSKAKNTEKVGIASNHTEATDQTLLNTISIDCECDKKSCYETIQMSTDEYAVVHRKANNFVVVPGHVKLDIEKILITFSNYLIVEKLSMPN